MSGPQTLQHTGARPVKAWIRKPGKSSLSTSRSDYDEFPVWDKKTGLPRLLMVCDVRNVAEYRQDSILGPMIKEIRDNNDFVDAALVRALMNNMIVAFIQNAHGLSRTSEASAADRIVEFEKGTILQGFRDEVPTFFDNNAPGPNFEAMMQSIVKRLGMATGRGPENVSREYKASYSASKASMAKAQQFNAAEHAQVLGPRFNAPAMGWMLYAGMLKGLIPARSKQHFLDNLVDYCATDWLPQPVVEIDRQKAASADKTELLESWTTTYQDVFGGRNKQWKKAIRQRLLEEKFKQDEAKQLGVDLSLMQGGESVETLRDEDIVQDGDDTDEEKS
ncbi:MAG: phage portal protein [Planctomycetota bacterium]